MNELQHKLAMKVLNHGKMRLFMLMKLPMGLLAGLKIQELTAHQTTVSVPFKYLNKNPFKSIYFAVQSMAAELSTATACMIAVHGHNPSVAFIIVDLKANFLKKANGRTYFTCQDNANAFEAVRQCMESGESATARFKTVGKLADGTVVSEFEFTWSFKQRRS